MKPLNVSGFEKMVLSESDKINQKGKLITYSIGNGTKVLEPIFQEKNGFIFENSNGKYSIKIEGKREDFVYWGWDLEHAKKVLTEKLLEHKND